MSDLSVVITGYVVGDNMQLDRTITELTAPIVTAWLTIKRSATQPDDDAIVSKEITTVAQDDIGEITEAGGVGTDGVLRFELTQEDTRNMGVLEYVFDVQVLLSSDLVYTPESGTIQLTQDVTRSTS